MKYLKLFILAAFLMTSVGSMAPVAHSSALSITDKRYCFKNFNGMKKPQGELPQDYKDHKCDETAGQGGNCQKKTLRTSGSTQVQITCSDPDSTGATSSSSDGSGGIPPAADPASQYQACESPDNCNFVKRYVNPFINKFLIPLASLAVVIGIIWGSIEYITSGGDPQRAAAGKARIQKALIGLLAFVFLYGFLNWLLPGGLL